MSDLPSNETIEMDEKITELTPVMPPTKKGMLNYNFFCINLPTNSKFTQHSVDTFIQSYF